MDIRPQWFRVATNAFAVIGVLAVMGATVAGLRRLIVSQPEPQGALRQEATATAGAAVATSSLGGKAPEPAPAPPPSSAKATEGKPMPAAGVGRPDLAVRIVDTGVIDAATSEFRRSDAVSRGEQPAIIFEISNLGGGRSESWQFHANLPTFAGAYVSDSQRPLAPGESVRFTIGFRDLAREGENRAVITLDPTNSLADRNRSNDVATAVLKRGY